MTRAGVCPDIYAAITELEAYASLLARKR